MRDELVRAAKAQPGAVSAAILKADKGIKRAAFGGWRVINKRRKKRGRRNRS